MLKSLSAFYDLNTETTPDEARVILFNKSCSPELVPSKQGCSSFSYKRAQVIWRQVQVTYPASTSPDIMGWKIEAARVEPIE